MYDWTDYITIGIGICLTIGLLALCIAGSYAIVESTNNPIKFKTYEINGNIPTLITKSIN